MLIGSPRIAQLKTAGTQKGFKIFFCVTEAAQSIKQTKAVKSKRIIQRQMGADTKVIAYADRGVKRIRTKMKAMEMRGVKLTTNQKRKDSRFRQDPVIFEETIEHSLL